MSNQRLFKQAEQCLVGGVDSPVRSFRYVGGSPLLVKSGEVAYVRDYDGREYIDYTLSWGAMLLGHRHPVVTSALKRQLGQGVSFGSTNAGEIALAREIQGAVPFMERIRFVNSGTEAVMAALRLARAYTKRDKVLKFEHAYHGHVDYLLVKGGSGLATLGIPVSAGVPRDFIRHTIVAPLHDRDALNKIFKKYGCRIAAAIIEPVGGNFGVIPPDSGFLAALRKITEEYGALLVFDEVITGFRFHYGSAAQLFAITPDLLCLGKIIGGGLPIGAYGGKEKIMRRLAPLGDVYQASTFGGNPLVMQAGLSTLGVLRKSQSEYERIARLTRYLGANLKRKLALRNINAEISCYGSMFSLKLQGKAWFGKFYRAMLRKGIYLAPSEFEANFISFAHTKKDMDKTIEAAGRQKVIAEGDFLVVS